jgi:hypothetical protein
MTDFNKSAADFKEWVDFNVHDMHAAFFEMIWNVPHLQGIIRSDAWACYKDYEQFRAFVMDSYIEIIRDELENEQEIDAANLIV